MSPQDFDTFAQLVKRSSGLALGPDKGYLLEARLGPVARAHGLDGLPALAARLRQGGQSALEAAVTEAMTTNESFFFRDGKPFDQFRDLVLPHLLQSRASTKRIRIWSAAASSGQEAYSLAMILKEKSAQLAGWRVEILGTDLSASIIQRAKEGVYTQFEVQRGLPIQQLIKYFDKDGDKWRIKPELRQMATFRTYNLLDSLVPLGQFDVVFCRNVLIYFDPPTKTRVLDAIARQMPADGMLYLGGAETIMGLTGAFAPYPGQRGLYAKTDAGGAVGLKLAS